MVKCPICSNNLVNKQGDGKKKICAQIGNPEIAIVEVDTEYFCTSCNDFYLNKNQLSSAIQQIKENSDKTKTLDVGIYK